MNSFPMLSLTLSALALALAGFGCTGGIPTTQLPAGSGAITAPPTVMQVIAAPEQQCPSGGVDVIMFQDVAGTGKFAAGDPVQSEEPVCNGPAGTAGATGATGATGAQGQGAGVLVAPAAAGACPAGGTSITTFIDPNNTGVFVQGDPVTSVSTVCNGVDGTNGQSAAITVTAASASDCANGGAVYTATSPGEDPEVTVICNGTNGTDAVFETGPVGPMVSGQAFSACHHDYLYLPDSTTPDRGWLLFRHQDNGADDQGIGSTGFQVWDADIADFELASEVGDVVYCTLHWDPNAMQLTWTVDATDDGLAGLTGTIQM